MPATVAAPRRPAGFWLVLSALIALTLLGWYYLVAWPMPMPGDAAVRDPTYVLLTFVMWLLMMVAMMTPSAAPAVLLFHRVQRGAWQRTAAFVAGYFVAWGAYSIAATVAQVLLIEAGRIDTMGVVTTRWSAAILIGLAAVWQWTPAKAACLQHCRSPVEFLSAHYHPGSMGAIRTGVEHGAYCVGCCWALMLLLFVGGVMSLAWVVGITLIVALEKMAPGGTVTRLLISAALWIAAIAVAFGVPFSWSPR